MTAEAAMLQGKLTDEADCHTAEAAMIPRLLRLLPGTAELLLVQVELVESKAARMMIVHNPHGLHEGIASRRSDESPASLSKLFAHFFRFACDRAFGVKLPCLLRLEAPEKFCKRSLFFLKLQRAPGVTYRGFDLAAMTYDAFVLE